MRTAVCIESFKGYDAPRRAMLVTEMKLNSGWEVVTSFVYKDGESGVETLHIIFSRLER